MSRKRRWEIGATAALLLAVAVAVCGFFYGQERQRRLDRELSAVLSLWANTSTRTGPLRSRMLSLLRRGAAVQAHDKEGGWTVVAVAAHDNDLPLLRKALSQGADINAAGEGEYPPLVVAVIAGSVESVALLLEQGVDVSQFGREALQFAEQHAAKPTNPRRQRHAAIVRLLKQHGAKD